MVLASEVHNPPQTSRPSFITPIPSFPPAQTLPLPNLGDNTFLDDNMKYSYAVATTHQYSNQDLDNILRYLVTKETPKFRTAKQKKLFLSKARPFYLKEAHMYKQRPGKPPQVVIFSAERQKEILWEAHEDIAHHGVWAVEQHLTLRYYWPGMKDQIKEHVRSCHTCQIRSTKKMHIPSHNFPPSKPVQ